MSRWPAYVHASMPACRPYRAYKNAAVLSRGPLNLYHDEIRTACRLKASKRGSVSGGISRHMEARMSRDTREILEEVRSGSLSVEGAILELKQKPFTDLGYAKVDLHRKIRQGVPEVIYGAGKTPEQIHGIVNSLMDAGEERVLITRLSPESAEKLSGYLSPASADAPSRPLSYYPEARIGIVGNMPKPEVPGTILIATGGTSDIPVAEEAALTAEYLGNPVVRLYDVGVAGLHRLLSHSEEIMQASVIIAIAGMEGALASVIGGMADCPVIAVPTSVGYGASFEGLSALLSMLNSCASGVSVVNIDNGFGAAFTASRINHRTPNTVSHER